jgi:uncharacterized RDD family membrane protein YckC
VIGFVVDQLVFAFLFSSLLMPLLVAAGIVVLPDELGTTGGFAEIEAMLAAPGLVLSQVVLTTVYRWVWNAIGWSPGKRLLGLRTIDRHGRPPGMQRGLQRALFAIVSDVPLWLGYAFAAWDPERRTWHDRFASTWVVRASAIAGTRRGNEGQMS